MTSIQMIEQTPDTYLIAICEDDKPRAGKVLTDVIKAMRTVAEWQSKHYAVFKFNLN